MLQVDNLTKTYGSQNAVDGISFEARPGEILGFLGPNGAGKSTTMKVACTYLRPSSGTVRVQGHDVQADPLQVRRLIGYLPEHNPLYLDMYVHEFLQFCGGLHGLRGASLRSRIAQVVASTGLGLEQHKKIGALSKGYRQRVGLAQAVLHDPPVLILDEPTTGLDPVQIVEIRQLIQELGRERTLVFSSHILQEVQAVCQRVVIISRGKIVADASLAQLQAQAGQGVAFVAEYEQDPPLEQLQAIAGVLAVQPLGQGRYQLQAADLQVRAAIFTQAAQHGHVLLGLQQQQHSLEQVFRSLTQQPA